MNGLDAALRASRPKVQYHCYSKRTLTEPLDRSATRQELSASDLSARTRPSKGSDTAGDLLAEIKLVGLNDLVPGLTSTSAWSAALVSSRFKAVSDMRRLGNAARSDRSTGMRDCYIETAPFRLTSTEQVACRRIAEALEPRK